MGYIWRGGNVWKFYLCAEHYDERVALEKEQGLPEDYDLGVLD